MGGIARLLDAVCRGIALSVGAAVLAMVCIVSYGVVARDLLNLSDVWETEVTTYLMAYMTFVGSAVLAWQARHLKVDVLSHYLHGRARRVLGLVEGAIAAAVAIVLLALSGNFWADAWTSGERSWGMFAIPLWIPYLCLLIGSALLALVQVVRLASMFSTPAPVARDGTGGTVDAAPATVVSARAEQ